MQTAKFLTLSQDCLRVLMAVRIRLLVGGVDGNFAAGTGRKLTNGLKLTNEANYSDTIMEFGKDCINRKGRGSKLSLR